MPFYGSLGYDKNRDFAPRAIDRLVALREQLRTEIPARTLRDTLLLATWNIRDFDSNKFGQGPRLEETYYYIAEVIAAFDLVAVQEVNDDLGPLERVMDILGPNWDFITTDVTEGVSGNGQRTAFVFDTRKVLFRNVAGEIVLPMGQAIGGAETIACRKPTKWSSPRTARLRWPAATKSPSRKAKASNCRRNTRSTCPRAKRSPS